MWVVAEPLLPNEPPKPKGGRPRVSDRVPLRGIVFVLRSGLPRGMLPGEVFGSSGMTCWRRLRDWQQAGGRRPAAPHPAGTARPGGRVGLVPRFAGRSVHR
ncbi:transposase [Jannaschia seosinensis]|uniref:transposase n=1 Tax=Jannaschia seosinensis TaxID=313367 RepID=UPI0035211CDD